LYVINRAKCWLGKHTFQRPFIDFTEVQTCLVCGEQFMLAFNGIDVYYEKINYTAYVTDILEEY